MRHSKIRYQLSRFSSWRKATVKSLAKSLLKYEQIKTTLVRAKSARPVVEKLIAGAKKNTLANKRRAFSVLGEHDLVNTLYNEIAPRFNETNGGFTRILKLGKRRGDNAELVLFELTKKSEKKLKPKAAKEHEHKHVPAAEGAEEAREKTQEKKTETAIKEKPTALKPQKKFLGGIRKIFKKERDSL
jgi:large subunit ribosomal protein L17